EAARSASSALRRRSASSASRTIACCSARISASAARLPLMSSRMVASSASRSAAGASAASAVSASARAPAASSRVVVRRTRASSSAETRAALRLASRAAAVQITLTLTCGIARLCLGRSRRAQGGFGGLLELTGGLGLDTGRLQLALDLGEAGALGQAPCRAGRSMSSGGEAIPAPQVAFARHQPLAGLELAGEASAGVLVDDADLVEPARQLARRLDAAEQRLDAVRQRRIGGIDRRAGPAHRRRRIGWGVEVVAERGAEGLLVALR